MYPAIPFPTPGIVCNAPRSCRAATESGSESMLSAALRYAETLALLYSDLKRSVMGDVIYTRRKWVKKAKGQAPGTVTVTQEQSISVKFDALRLAALKERSP